MARLVGRLPLGVGDRLGPMFDGQGLKARALRGSVWTMTGFGVAQVLRLASNLILTRLLFPEAFGLMALVAVFMQGLAMFSDVGIGPSIIQNKRGDDPDFYNTAWTIQVGRGFLLWLGACALAWPVSQIYAESMLVRLLPVAGLSAVLAGFNSTKIFTCNRHLNLGRLTLLELGSQVIAVTCLVAFAWWLQSVWALVIGNLIGAAIKAILAQTALPGPINRFRWDPSATKALFSFGKWIFMTTMLTFVARQGDRLILGGFLTAAEFGVYSIAVFLSEAIGQIVGTLTQRVVFPSLSQVSRNNPTKLRKTLAKTRSHIELIAMPFAGFLIAAGPWLIGIMYDDRYAAAGWMIQLLALRLAFFIPAKSMASALVAMGKPKWCTLAEVVRGTSLIVGLVLGFIFGGLKGALMGIVLAQIMQTSVLEVGVKFSGIQNLDTDVKAAFYCALGLTAGYLVVAA